MTRREISPSTLLQEGRAWAAPGMGQETPNFDTTPGAIPSPALWVSQDINILEGKILHCRRDKGSGGGQDTRGRWLLQWL